MRVEINPTGTGQLRHIRVKRKISLTEAAPEEHFVDWHDGWC